jgi:hypothetical protein
MTGTGIGTVTRRAFTVTGGRSWLGPNPTECITMSVTWLAICSARRPYSRARGEPEGERPREHVTIGRGGRRTGSNAGTPVRIAHSVAAES